MVHTATQDDQTVPPMEGGRRKEGGGEGGREGGGRREEGREGRREEGRREEGRGAGRRKRQRGEIGQVIHMHECVYLLLVLLYKTVVAMAVLELGEVAVSDLHRPQHCH